MTTTLRGLVDSLPTRNTEFAQVNVHRAVFTSISEVPDYVWPDLSARSVVDGLHSTPVVLVTAPGAMGKSAAARTVASATNGLYVDLAKMNVGSGTLTGEVSKALGFSGAEDFFSSLSRGEATLVLDSTDEAQLRAGTENFIEFVRDLAWQLSNAKSHGQIVMFGRSDSIDLSLLALDELAIRPPVFEIAPLSHAGSAEFISRQLDRKTDERRLARVHRIHEGPFARLRDRVFLDIMQALGSDASDSEQVADAWLDTQMFLGYPPVLTAIGERLIVPNPSDELALLGESSSSKRKNRGELLRGIVEDILDRESDKARSGTGERLGIRVGDPVRESLYTREEQVARLLRVVGVAGVEVAHPGSLDDEDRNLYETLVDSFIQDHPFLRVGRFGSEVFSDYVRAWAISSPVRGAWVVDEPAFVSSLPPAGPFFANFVAALAPTVVPELPESQISEVVASYKRGVINPRIGILQRTESGTLVLSDDDSDDSLLFQITDLSGVITLESPVSRTSIFTDMGVRLNSSPSGQVEVGPDVFVIAEDFEVHGNRLHVVGRDLDTGFSMFSASVVTQPGDLKVSAHPTNTLFVDFPGAWHQWKPFVFSRGSLPASVGRGTLAQVLVATRRILTSFRPSTTATPTVSADKVDRLLVGRNETYGATRDALLKLDVLGHNGAQYSLNLTRLAEFHVSWSDLRGDDPAKALKDLCGAVLRVGAFS